MVHNILIPMHFILHLVDREGGTYRIVAYGVQNISDDLQVVDISSAKSEFSVDVQNI